MKKVKQTVDERAAERRREKRAEAKRIATQLYKEIFPDASLSVLSGPSPMFDRFITLAEKLQKGIIVV